MFSVHVNVCGLAAFCVCAFCLAFFLILFVLCMLVCFHFIFPHYTDLDACLYSEREDGCGSGWMGRRGGFGSGWGRGTIIRIYCADLYVKKPSELRLV